MGVPDKMARVTRKDGVVVPYYVKWEGDKPMMDKVDPEKFKKCVGFRCCWWCGDKLGKYVTFVNAAISIVNRLSAFPPGHQDCATWAAEEFKPLDMDVRVVWTTDDVKVHKTKGGAILFVMGDPVNAVKFYKDGRAAEVAEIRAEIEQGLPRLFLSAAEMGQMTVERLMRDYDKGMELIP